MYAIIHCTHKISGTQFKTCGRPIRGVQTIEDVLGDRGTILRLKKVRGSGDTYRMYNRVLMYSVHSMMWRFVV